MGYISFVARESFKTKTNALMKCTTARIGAEYGCAGGPRTLANLVGFLSLFFANFYPYFTQSTVFTQICDVNMKCALAKSFISFVFSCSHLSVCLLIIHCLFTNMKHPNFDVTKLLCKFMT